MATYRAATYANMAFTGPEHSDMPEEQLVDEAVEEARRGNVLGSGENRVTEEELRREIVIEQWKD